MKIGMGWDVTFNTFEHPQVSLAVAVRCSNGISNSWHSGWLWASKKAVKISAL